MTDDEIDAAFPFQIILPHECYRGTMFRTVEAFCIGLSLADRGHVVLTSGEYRYVFAFQEWNDADKLRQRYGGQWFKGGDGIKVDECTHRKKSQSSAPR